MTESPMPALVVPVLNDAGGLERLLEWWWESGAGVPVWVVDGGSQDGSVEVAHRAGVGVIGSLPGRAVQMNRGAEAAARAGCNVFWFVHADSLPPKEAVRMIVRAIEEGAIGGGFARRYDVSSRFLRLTCVLSDWRCRLWGWFLGDQAMFVRRDAFERLGGFPEWRIFEDLEFSRRLRRLGRTVLVQPPLLTSGRRFTKRGAVRQTLEDLVLTIRYLRCQDGLECGFGGLASKKRPASASDRVFS